MKLFSSFTFLLLLYSSIAQSQVNGSGTANNIPKFTAGAVIGNSTIYENPGGNVGIGTTNPLSSLDVVGTFHTSYNSQTPPVSYGAGGLSVNWNKSGGGAEVNFWNVYDAAVRSYQFSQKTGANTYVDLLTINANGNTGIGRLPESKLDIQTTSANDGIILRYNTDGFLKITANSLQTESYNKLTRAGDAGIFFGGSGAGVGTFGFVLSPWDNSLKGLRMDKDGNVGIATYDTKGYQLAVAGAAVFTRAVVKVQANWPDYVFDQSYILPSLQSLDVFIKNHRHLPGVPSAEEVEKNGIDIGSNQAMLLKKIEELTLYIIKQEKKIDQLEDQNNHLNILMDEMKELKSQIKNINQAIKK